MMPKQAGVPVRTERRPRYCIVSPCRDEAAYARRALDSVVDQSLRPAQWVIVDDGSTDDTARILADYAAHHHFIRVIRLDDRGSRQVGGGVIAAFNAGLQAIDLDEYDYLCKLDLDLILPQRYFQTLVDRMEANPRLGTCSGKAYFEDPVTAKLVSEKIGDEVSVGASKFYRTQCFREIGGFVPEVMWDGIDCHRCRMLGWIACSWDDPELRFLHLRPMGTSDRGWLRGRARHGFGQYFMGTGPVYMAASCVYRMTCPPRIIGGLSTAWGYFISMLRRERSYDDPEFRRFLRRYQRDCLLHGKWRATERLNRRQASLWRHAKAHTVPSPRAHATTPQPGLS